VSGRLTDFIARSVRQFALLTPPASIQFLVVCRRAFIANGVTLSEIGMELTSQKVVFAFFFVESWATIGRSFSIFQQTVCSSDERKKMPRPATAERGKS
jgi:hypothetical protein